MKYKNIAIITAAGSGIRLSKSIKKQYIQIEDKPLIYYTIKTFNQANFIDEIILVSDKDGVDYVKNDIVEKYSFNKVTKVVEGGNRRFESVYKGFKAIEERNSIVVIHDGVRPFVDKKTIKESINKAEEKGAAVAGIKATDTIKIIEDGKVIKTLDRNKLWQIQTPQTFKYEILKNSYLNIDWNDKKITDEAYIVEKNNHEIYMVIGSKRNLKITTTFDLKFAEYLINVEK